MYSLNLSDDNRILSACVCLDGFKYNNTVDTLPDGNITDYKYIDGKYVYEPLPETESSEPAPTIEERLSAIEDVMLEMMGV